jgi:hypothetical protein
MYGMPHPSCITSLDTRSKDSKAEETFEKLSPLKWDSCINVLHVWELKKGSVHKHLKICELCLVSLHVENSDT